MSTLDASLPATPGGVDPPIAAVPAMPFRWALGDAIDRLAPGVREHVLQTPGTTVVYRGTMRVWRDGGLRGRVAGRLLRLGVRGRTLFPETGERVEFEMRHAVRREAGGALSMTWVRTFRFDDVTRRFDAVMRFHEDRGPIVDWIGAGGWLHVELVPRVTGDAIEVRSRGAWIRAGRLRVPVPDWLKGRPQVVEREGADGTLHIRVVIHNVILGQVFGYEGRYRRIGEPGPLPASDRDAAHDYPSSPKSSERRRQCAAGRK